jgi:hypothetical protein
MIVPSYNRSIWDARLEMCFENKYEIKNTYRINKLNIKYHIIRKGKLIFPCDWTYSKVGKISWLALNLKLIGLQSGSRGRYNIRVENRTIIPRFPATVIVSTPTMIWRLRYCYLSVNIMCTTSPGVPRAPDGFRNTGLC